MRIYKVTGYNGEYYRTSRIALSKEEARDIAEDMEAEGIYRYIHVTMKILHTPKQLDALDSYLASIGK